MEIGFSRAVIRRLVEGVINQYNASISPVDIKVITSRITNLLFELKVIRELPEASK